MVWLPTALPILCEQGATSVLCLEGFIGVRIRDQRHSSRFNNSFHNLVMFPLGRLTVDASAAMLCSAASISGVRRPSSGRVLPAVPFESPCGAGGRGGAPPPLMPSWLAVGLVVALPTGLSARLPAMLLAGLPAKLPAMLVTGLAARLPAALLVTLLSPSRLANLHDNFIGPCCHVSLIINHLFEYKGVNAITDLN